MHNVEWKNAGEKKGNQFINTYRIVEIIILRILKVKISKFLFFSNAVVLYEINTAS